MNVVGHEFSIPVADFHNAIKNVVHFASTDKSLEILNTGFFFIRNGNLIVEATDRYKLVQILIGNVRTEGDDGYEHQDLGVLHIKDLKRLEQQLRADAERKDKPEIALGFFPESALLEVYDLETDSIQRIPMVDDMDTYPPIDSLFPDVLPQDTDTFKSLDTRHVQSVTKLVDTRHPRNSQSVNMHYTKGGNTPVIVHWLSGRDQTVWAQGLVMPLQRIANETDPNTVKYF